MNETSCVTNDLILKIALRMNQRTEDRHTAISIGDRTLLQEAQPNTSTKHLFP
jgi:hypothetical protein